MNTNEPSSNQDVLKDTASFKRVRNAVILPDGSSREPLGSGVITGILGVGGMANVYEIWNTQLEISRAVKLLHPNYTEEAKQRFETEIKITAKLHHPNIIEIHNVGNWNGLPYIEMERIYGQTLETILNERGALPTEVCTAIGIMIGRALRYAHNQEYIIYGKTYHGVIHRDLKPSNIMISTRGIMKLMDFGIARPTDASIHTTDGSILGTMQYLSPEQLDGKDADIRSDIYSLGTILYEMITGTKAFPESNASRLMLSKIKNDFKSLDKFELKIPLRLRRLVHKCLVHDREKRVQDAAAFLSELTRIHKSIASASPEQVVKEFIGESAIKKRTVSLRDNVPVLAFGALAFIVLSGTVFVLWWTQKQHHFLQKDIVSSVKTVDSLPHPEHPITQTTIESLLRDSLPVRPPILSKHTKKSEKKTVLLQVAPVPESKPVSILELTLFEKLSNQYGISDTLDLFIKTVQNKRYVDASELYSLLSKEDAYSDAAVIYRLRMLKGLGKKVELNRLLVENEINDGEFLLEKAIMYIAVQKTQDALTLLELSSRTRSAYLEGGTLHLEYLYHKARCMSQVFDKTPTNESKNIALDSWFEVKSELQTHQQHRYFKEADDEMQRITQKLNSDKG